jgi:hypothetical protein
MDTAPDPSSLPTSTPQQESDVSVCLAAIGRALEAEFRPRVFLDDLSAELCPLVPHDRLGIGYLADDRRTFSVFSEHGAPGFLPELDSYTTDLERPVRFPVADTRTAPSTSSGFDPIAQFYTRLKRLHIDVALE